MTTRHYCGTCAAFDESNGGECHYDAPRSQIISVPQKTLQGTVPTPVPVTYFPKVDKNHWCLRHTEAGAIFCSNPQIKLNH